MKIEVGKYYKTREGKKVRVYAVDGVKPHPIHGAILLSELWHALVWTRKGELIEDEIHDFDITSVWEDTESKESQNYNAPLDFDWGCLPEEADRYIAKDFDGTWCAFGEKPVLDRCVWVTKDYRRVRPIPEQYCPRKFTGSWVQSLLENPKYSRLEGSESINIQGIDKVSIRAKPINIYKLDVDKIKSIEDIKNIFRLMDISVDAKEIPENCKHLFKEK